LAEIADVHRAIECPSAESFKYVRLRRRQVLPVGLESPKDGPNRRLDKPIWERH